MKSDMHVNLKWIAFWLLGFFVADIASAYILPAEFIMRTLGEKRRRMRLKDLTIHLETTRPDQSDTIEERIYIKKPERFRREQQLASEVKVTVQKLEAWAEGTDKLLKRNMHAPDYLLATLLMPRGEDLEQLQERLLKVLQGANIDSTVVSISRYNGAICYIIGAQVTEKQKNQLWVDKETFLPVRMIMVMSRDGKKQRIEYQWLEYGSSTTAEWFPRITVKYVNDKIFYRSEVNAIEANQKLPETLFAIP